MKLTYVYQILVYLTDFLGFLIDTLEGIFYLIGRIPIGISNVFSDIKRELDYFKVILFSKLKEK